MVFESTLVPGLVILDTAPGRSAGPSAVPQPTEDRTPALLKALKDLEATGWVEFVEPDYLVKLTGSPTEPGLGSGLLWGLRNTGAGGGLAGVDIGADAAWQTTTGSSNVVVAVIDSGIQSNHPDLAANIWRNEKEIPGNGLDDDGNGHVDDYLGVDLVAPGQPISDPDGHGTHVAGTIAAVGNGGGSAVGVAWGAKVLPIRVLDEDGKGAVSLIIKGLEHAGQSAARPKTVNASLGWSAFSQCGYLVIQALGEKGILVVCAAGNDSENNDEELSFPANYRLPNVLSVAAVRRDGALAGFSNYGAESVHVAAPGEDIFSTWPVSSYLSDSGTSMAAPHVSGVAALILSLYPDASMVELRQRILQSCLPLPMLGNKVVTGGIVRADRALRIGPDGNPEFELMPLLARALLAQVSNAVEVVVSDVLPLGGGTLQIRVGTSPAVILKDDGVVPDRVAGDGVYSGTLSGLPPGALAIRYELARAGRVWSSERLIRVEPPPANDAFVDRVRLASAETVTTGTFAGATLEVGEPGYSVANPRRSVWYQWAVPAGVPDIAIRAVGLDCEPELDVFTGITLGSLKPVPVQVISTGPIAGLVLSAVPNQILQIRVSSTNTHGGRFGLIVGGSGLRPLNDNRIAALPILSQVPAGIAQEKTASSDSATREVGEPAHAGVTGGRSLWWKFTAPASGVLECKTRGSDFDTLLAVYPAGSAIALAGNDDYGWGEQWSWVNVEVQAGQTYDIAVDGYNGKSGRVVLTAKFWPGTNDDFGAATELTAGQTIPGNNFGAGIEPFEPIPDVPVGAPSWRAGRSVWYKWTAPSGGRARVTITPRTSGLNLKAAVYHDRARQQTLNFFSNLRTLMSQVDGSTAGGVVLEIPFDAAAGQEYRISVDGLYYTQFLFGDAWEQGYFDILVELTTEIGLIYRTEFEVNWEGLLSPVSALKEAAFTTPGIWDSGAVRMTQSGTESCAWIYPFARLDGYGPLTARMSFRMDGTVPAAGWFIGFSSRPLAGGGSTLSDSTAISGIIVDGAGIDSAVFNYQSGLTSTNPLPRLGTNQRHFVELTMDGSVGLLTAAVDNLLPRSVPFTLAGSRNILAGPYFIGTPGAGSLVIDKLEIRAAPMALGIQVPFVRLQPTWKNLATGETLELEAQFGGEGLSFQWLYQGKPLAAGAGISGTQETRLTITGVTVSNTGAYRLVASNSVGQVTTAEALVTVQPPPPPGPTNVVWSVAGGGARMGVGDLVLAERTGAVLGFRGRDGSNYWRINVPAGFVGLNLVATADDGAVVVSSQRGADGSHWLLIYDDPAAGVPSGSVKLDRAPTQVLAVVGDSQQRRVVFVDPEAQGGVYEPGNGLLWRRPELGALGGRLVPLSRALVGGYTLPDEHGVAAYEYATGATLWRWRFWERPQVAVPQLVSLKWAGNDVLLAQFDRRLVAIDAKTGAEKWRVELGGESNGILIYDAETVVGKLSGQSWTYAWRRATGEPFEAPLMLNQPLWLGDARVLDNGAVLVRDGEYGNGTVRWQMPAGSSQSLVGVAGSGRVIYEGGLGLFAVAGSGSPLSRRSPSPAPLGTFHIPGSKGYLDADLTALRPARGLAVVRNGGVAEIDVFDPGVGYTNRTPVSITGGGGTGAIAEAVMKDGGVWSVSVRNPGSGYTNAPVIRFGPPAYPARIAVAEPQIVNGFIVGLTVKDGGWGYLQAPVVRFEGGSGRGATAVARINADGQVSAIEMEESGLGYTVAPTVWIEPPILPIPELAVTRGTRLQFDGLSVGTTYRLQSETAGWQDVGDAFVAGASSVGFHAATERAHRLVRLPMPQTAAGTLTVVNGFVVGVTVTEPGSGYAEAPQVAVEDTLGSGARVVATVQAGRVSGATIEASGRGYTGGAVVRFASPPVAALVPLGIPELRIQYSNVSTSLPYRLHAGSSLEALEPAGEVFLPPSVTGLLYRDMNRDHELIQLRYVR
jgi:subtilisin family serine protease